MKKLLFHFGIIFSVFFLCNISPGQSDLDKQLLDAVKQNNIVQVQSLVEQGANVNAADENGANCLMWAAYNSDLDMVKHLVEKGADYKKKGVIYTSEDSSGYYGNLLGISVNENKFEMLKYFIDTLKIDINDREYNPKTKKDDSWSALHYAVSGSINNEILIFLLEKSADVNISTDDGTTPLILAVERGYFQAVKILILYNADIGLINKKGESALDIAKESTDDDIYNFLKNPVVDEFDLVEFEMFKELKLRIDKDKNVINSINNDGKSLLHIAVLNENIYLINYLLEKNAAINIQDNYGNTPVHYAFEKKQKDIIMLFIEIGVNLNILNKEGKTVLLEAITWGDNYLVEYLLLKGAKLDNIIDFKDKNGYNLLHYAAENNDVKLFYEIMAISDFDSFSTVNMRDLNGNTPLLIAIFNSNIDLIKLLIEYGADVNISNTSGYKPIYYASILGLKDIVKFLISKGARYSDAEYQKPQLICQTNHSKPFKIFNTNHDIIVTSDDISVKLWSINSKKLLKTLNISLIKEAQIDSTSNFLVIQNEQNNIELWDIISGVRIKNLKAISDNTNKSGGSFNWKNNKAVTFSGRNLFVRNIKSGELQKSYELRDEIKKVIIGNELIFILTESNSVLFLNLNYDTNPSIFIKSNDNKIEDIALSNTEKYLLILYSPDLIELWDVDKKMLIKNFNCDLYSSISKNNFNQFDNELLIPKRDSICIYDIEKSLIINNFFLNNINCDEILFDHYNNLIILDANELILFNLKEKKGNKIINGFMNSSQYLKISPDENKLMIKSYGFNYALGENYDNILLWSFQESKMTNYIKLFSPNIISFDTNSKLLISSYNYFKKSNFEFEINEVINYSNIYSEKIELNLISEDRRYLLASTEKSKIFLYDIRKEKIINEFYGVDNKIINLTIDPQSTYINADYDDGTSILWEIESGKEVKSTTINFTPRYSVFSNDCKFLVKGDYFSNVNLYDIPSFTISNKIKREYGPFYYKPVFSPNNKYIIVPWYNKNMENYFSYIYDIQSDTIKYNLPNTLYLAKFNKNGKYLALASNYDIELWQVNEMKLLHTYKGHNSWIQSLDFLNNDDCIISSSEDGTIRLWDLYTEKELASLISYDSTNWAVITPEGFWDASEGGRKLMHWTVGMETISLDQIRKNEVPGLLKRILKNGLRFEGKENEFNNLKLYPEFTFDKYAAEQEGRLKISLKNRNGGIGNIIVIINGKEWIITPEKAGYNPDADSVYLDIDLRESGLIMEGRNHKIEISVMNNDINLPVSSRGFETEYKDTRDSLTYIPKLWVLASGINTYEDFNIKELNYAVKDAQDFSEMMRKAGCNLFGESNVNIKLLTSESKDKSLLPTRENIISSLEEIKSNAKYDDIIMLYFSGHGINIERDDFYYPCINSKKANFKDTSIRNTAISGTDILEYLRIPVRKQAVILDVCGGGGIGYKQYADATGRSDENELLDREKVLRDMKEKGGLYIISGASRDKESFEHRNLGHGFLTFNLLNYFKISGTQKSGQIQIEDMFNYAKKETENWSMTLLNDKQTPVIIIPWNIEPFVIGYVSKSDTNHILKIIIPGSFTDKTGKDIKYKISDKFNEALKSNIETKKEFIGKLIYSREGQNAYKIWGQYTINGDEIKLNYSITKGDTEITPENGIETEGKINEIDKLLDNIVKSAVKFIIDN